MAVGNIYVFAFFTVLVAVNLIFAEESSLELGSELFDQVDISADAEREVRSPNEEEGKPQERFFFSSLFTTTCNYTSQAGSTCTSCRQARYCSPNNMGVLRNCIGFLPFCNNGRCSFLPGSLCNFTG